MQDTLPGTPSEELERARAELREAQTHLLEAARRATVANLAQGLAHEINNALTPILASAQLIALKAEPGSELAERADQIMTHAKRIASLTATMRQLSQTSSGQSVPFSFNGLISDVLEIYRDRLERTGIRLELELDDGLPVLEGRPDQIQEVIFNVLQNAIESMPQGGALRVSTCYLERDGRVCAQVSDSGSGILSEHLDLIFEPGFTTKASGPGSHGGWGLFTARQLVQAHGGELEIESQPSQGTRAIIRLPAQSG